jgi:hypothetical protein
MREHLTLTILLALAELVRLFVLSKALVTVTVLLATSYYIFFLPTFTDTGHIQRVLHIGKFISYFAL